MNDMKHTPGPWHLIETEPGIEADMDVFVTTPRYAGGTGLIARVVDADDAVLIAAAPALLAALKVLMHDWVIVEHLKANDPMALAQARTAIAATSGTTKE